jgi:hypothetical protein
VSSLHAGFLGSIAPAIKWVITAWLIFSREALISLRKPKNAKTLSKPLLFQMIYF